MLRCPQFAIIEKVIIDFHTHICPPHIREERSHYLRLDRCFASLYGNPKAKLATAEELIASMDEDGVDLSVVVNFGWSSDELCRETNDYILEAVSRYPKRLVGFIMVQPKSAQAMAEIERCVAGGARGVGELRSDTQGFDMGDQAVMGPLVEAARKHRLILLSHVSEPVGHQYFGKGAITPDIIYRFVTNFPDLPLVCAHWGGGLPFYALMPEVAEALSQTYFDTAATPFLYRDDVFKHVAELVGAGKILFGSDYPLMPQRRVINLIRALTLPDEVKEMILGGNAQRLLEETRRR